MLRYTSCHLQSITELRVVRTEASAFPTALRFELCDTQKNKRRTITCIYDIKWIFPIPDTDCVLCQVRDDVLYII